MLRRYTTVVTPSNALLENVASPSECGETELKSLLHLSLAGDFIKPDRILSGIIGRLLS